MSNHPDVGDRVLYRIGGSDDHPELRPADVVRLITPTTVHVVVFTAGSEDLAYDRPGVPGQPLLPEAGDGIACRVAHRGANVGEWRVK